MGSSAPCARNQEAAVSGGLETSTRRVHGDDAADQCCSRTPTDLKLTLDPP